MEQLNRAAIITGITGQDGSYLAEYLLGLGYTVYGGLRRSSNGPLNLNRLKTIFDHPKLHLLHLDLQDTSSIGVFIRQVFRQEYHKMPPQRGSVEVYHLAAQSHVGESFKYPVLTHQINAVATVCLLSSLVEVFGIGGFKFYQASTSELYGNSGQTAILSESSPMHPTSPYAISKHCAYLTVKMYREALGVFAVNGILFNHESPRRGVDFVTRKITDYVGRGDYTSPLRLGSLDSRRDWGDARDYVRAMHLMLQPEVPKDYVVATGISRSVREFATAAFKAVNVAIKWQGAENMELGYNDTTLINRDMYSFHPLVIVDSEYYRPSEVHYLQGDASLIKRDLGWKPRITFEEMVRDMVKSDALL
jgi:GDPmannose 4,6-dehydratase